MADGFQSLQVSLANDSDHWIGFLGATLSLMAFQICSSLFAAPRPMASMEFLSFTSISLASATKISDDSFAVR